MRSNSGLARRPILVISVLLILGFLVTSLASYFVSVSSLRSQISHDQLPVTSDNVYSEIQQDLFRPILISSFMASDTFLRDWVLAGEHNEPEIRRYLQEIRSRYDTVVTFFVSEKTRIYYHPDGILKRVSPDAERDVWYFRVREMEEEYELNIDRDMANDDEMTVFVNYRVYDYDGNYIGTTGVGLTVDSVRRLIERYQQEYDRRIFFLDRDGNVTLAGTDFPDQINNLFQAENYQEFAEQFQVQAENSFSYRRGGQRILANTRYIPELDWYLAVEQAEGQATADVFSTLIVNLLIFVVISTIILLLVRFAFKAYQRQINTLRGIVPICSHCKRIRDDRGYWNQVEAYVADHSEATFSHGICPDCLEKYYSEYVDE